MPDAPPNPLTMTDEQLRAHYAAMDAEDEARKARLDAPDALSKAARWYGSVGIPVFPLRPGGKTPAIGKAHPDDAKLQKSCPGDCGKDGHGLYDASTDADRVDGWWERWPQANIGLPTGRLFDVIDIDGPQGYRTYADRIVHGTCPKDCSDVDFCPGDGHTLAELVGPAGILARALTRGENGGLHLYVAATGDPNTSHILPGIDYRGLGGYVVAPPSKARLGRYSWVEPLDPAVLRAVAA